MARCFSFFLMTVFQWICLPCAALNLQVTAESALLINADTGAVLFEKQADETQYPASCTKIAMALYALNRGGVALDTVITAEGDALTPTTEAAKKRANYALPAYWLETDGCHIGLTKGEQLTLRDLLFGAMLLSANDASNVIAHYIGGSIPQFMKDLNKYLREINCTSTNYVNPHGLHHPDHATTARDLAQMTREALKNPLFAEMVSTIRYNRAKTNVRDATTFVHTNRLLRQGTHHYAKAIGVKTGYHARAKHNVVAAACEGDRTLILVLMHAADRKEMLQEVKRVFEAAFREPKVERTLLEAGAQPYALKLPGSWNAVETYLPESVSYAYFPAEEPKIKALIYWDDVTLPVQKGQRLGEIRFIAENERLLTTAPLYAKHELRPSTWYRISTILPGSKTLLCILLLLLGVAMIYGWRSRSRLRYKRF